MPSLRIEHEYFLLEEVLVHCNFALVGLQSVLYHLEDNEDRQHKGVWADLQMGLTHAAIVSAYLFSIKPNTGKRTSFLQGVLKPSDNSPLRNKNARNYLTHIDEKFDYWLNNQRSPSGLLEAVLPDRKAFDFYDKDRFFIRRVILMKELIFVYQSGPEIKEFEITPLLKELEIVLYNGKKYLQRLDNDDNGIHFIRP